MAAGQPPARPIVPPPQDNLQVATDKALEALAGQSPEQLRWLGAAADGPRWRLAVPDDVLLADPAVGSVRTLAGAEVGAVWRVLVLHYLAVTARPEAGRPEVTFADLPGGRTYAGVYHGRVVGRLCATVGRDADTLRAAAAALGARPAAGGDVAFELDVFPRVEVRVIWRAADDEFPPSATVLLPRNIGSFFCIEDTVVLSERVVGRLCGRPF